MRLPTLATACVAIAFFSANATPIERRDDQADTSRTRFGWLGGAGFGSELGTSSPIFNDSGSQSAADGKCTSYTIISTRGTGELQGPSAGFRTMNSQILQQIPGGKVYNTVYPASVSQNSASGTADIVNKVTSTLASDPSACFLLEGYSQGAAATVNAMSKLTGNSFDAVKGVFLIGDPCMRAGLPTNVDPSGGTSTRNSNGLQRALCGIPSNWYSKTLDVCKQGDGVCQGYGITPAHLQYGFDSETQSLGTKFGTTVLNGGTYTHN